MPHKIVIQYPKTLKYSELPFPIKKNQIFSVNNIEYVCILMRPNLNVAEINENETGIPENVESFFWIREK